MKAHHATLSTIFSFAGMVQVQANDNATGYWSPFGLTVDAARNRSGEPVIATSVHKIHQDAEPEPMEPRLFEPNDYY